MLQNILKLKGVQQLDKQQQKEVKGGRAEIDGVCCFNSADFHMESIPNYADPSAEGYLTHAQRHDIWLYYYDACMGGQDILCVPVQ
ncbi:hypothetical protein [Kordia zhangzhouensis]|uniref:hypothetical protein n=1 Tax=Kordia zhangzhouensis TaxID=1620405 RepID=UPI000629CF03|nr:hypothetical protein [Kordia zhangzhouensis]